MSDSIFKYIFSSARHTNVECPLHLQITMEIVLVNEGTLCMEIGGKDFKIGAGCGAFIQPFELHCFKNASPNICHILRFSGELVPYFFKFSKAHIPTSPIFKYSAESISLTEKLLPQLENNADPIRAQAVLAPLCNEIYFQCGFQPRQLPAPDTMQVAINYIHSNFSDSTISSKQIALMVGVHPVTFSRGFNCIVGMGFNQYLNHLRCSNAAMLLTSSDYTVTDIAFKTGFGSIRSFNRAFLNTYGITPTEYRASPNI